MRSEAIPLLLLALLLMISIDPQLFKPIEAQAFTTIYIRADGSIDPPAAPIMRDGSTYTLTGDIYGRIVIEGSDIVVDGAGHTLFGDEPYSGISLANVVNVAIKSFNFVNFGNGVELSNASRSTVSWNNMTWAKYCGIVLRDSSSNVVRENNVALGEPHILWFASGIYLERSSGNEVAGNSVMSFDQGITLLNSYNNTVYGNSVAFNDNGFYIRNSSNNKIYRNSIIRNDVQVLIVYGEPRSVNTWDDGYPSGGNYWSDYMGRDADGDGIGDEPLVIDDGNIDRYPLMNPPTQALPPPIMIIVNTLTLTKTNTLTETATHTTTHASISPTTLTEVRETTVTELPTTDYITALALGITLGSALSFIISRRRK